MAIYLWNKQTGKREKLAGDNMLAGLPIGATIAYISEIAPRGFLPYDGSTYNKVDYPELFDKIPAVWKISDSQFTIPDAKGRTIQGADGDIGQLIEAGLPNITGKFGAVVGWNYEGAFSRVEYVHNYSNGTNNAHYNVTIDASKGETKTDGTIKTSDEHHVYGSSDTVQPPAIAQYFYIKATNYTDVQLDVIDDQKFTADNVLSAKKVKEELDQRSNYSTEETVIGKWIDGKPIYRVVINFTSPVSTQTDTLTVGNSIPESYADIINSIKYITNATMIRRTGECASISTSSQKVSSNVLRYYNPTQYINCDGLILEYTKTTD